MILLRFGFRIMKYNFLINIFFLSLLYFLFIFCNKINYKWFSFNEINHYKNNKRGDVAIWTLACTFKSVRVRWHRNGIGVGGHTEQSPLQLLLSLYGVSQCHQSLIPLSLWLSLRNWILCPAVFGTMSLIVICWVFGLYHPHVR